MAQNPKYDNDYVNLGYLKKVIDNLEKNTTQEATEALNKLSKNYTSPPVPPYYKDSLLCYEGKIYKCNINRLVGVFSWNDWSVVATDDTLFNEFKNNTYVNDLLELQEQIDNKVETHYQEENPALNWTTDLEKSKHVGDYWYKTTDNTQWRYCSNTKVSPITYDWEKVNVPNSIFDLIDTKKSIYTSKPSSYNKDDLWIIEDGILSNDLPVGTEENPIKIGDWVFATQNSDSFDKSHWIKKDENIDTKYLEEHYYTIGETNSKFEEVERNTDSKITKSKEEIQLEVSQNYTAIETFNTAINDHDKQIGEINKTIETQEDSISKLSVENGKISSSVADVTTRTELLETIVEIFSTDLDIYNLTIPVDSEHKPLEPKNYTIKFYSYFKGTQVTPTVECKSTQQGIEVSSNNTEIILSISDSPITNLNNEVLFEFNYNDGSTIHTLTKKIIVTLSLKGETGPQGIQGEVGPQGPQGIQGPAGVDGTSTYFYVKYSSNSSGSSMTDSPNENTKYMGVSSTTSPTAPTSASAYTWSLIKGADGNNGSPGQAGADGKTTYLHIKYSEDGTTFTPATEEYAEGEKPSAYIGQYVDYTEEDSTNFEDYKWYKFTEDIDDTLSEMQNEINNNSVNINNNYQELNEKLNEKASVENITEITNRVDTLQNSTDYTITVLEDIQVNGVTKVHTETGFTFDENGLNIDKSDAPTGGKFDEAGMEIVDKLTAALTTLFYSGYVDEEIAGKVDALTKYLGQTVTYSNSLIFQKYLSSMNMRLEDIEHDIFGKGLGFFTIGSDE